MAAEDSKAVVRRFYEVVWEQGNLTAIDDLFAEEFINHDPGPHSADREGFKEYVTWALQNSGYRPTIDDMIAEADKVAVRITGRGRIKRKILGLTVADAPFAQRGIVIWRIAGGKIAERWAIWEQ